ncbi:hypothetical protein AK830_g5729 [Neonectria ditissima]|uniref:Clr5 domain-containing protein n=1 Tax=Neonectria ditissima TaxID=78410 RepID=A0A0P7BDX7_9HYPO|nr:hypothetical protein AK830_g5729 [Neonectria ditissima]
MGPSRPQPTAADWLRYKATIRRLYLGEEMPLKELVTEVGNLGLVVTKAQLEYKLKKWEFRRNVDKETWASIDRKVSRRKRKGKESQVIHYGKRLKSSTIEKETNRHRDMANSSHPTFRLPYPSVHSPYNMNVDVCTPLALPMEFNAWPSTLPWFKFQATHFATSISENLEDSRLDARKTHVSQTVRSHLSTPTINTACLQLLSTGERSKVPILAAIVGKTMPESYPGEHLQRAHTLLSKPDQERLPELVKITVYGISNNLFDFQCLNQWTETVGLLRNSGVFNLQVDLGKFQDITLCGFIDNLFSAATYWLTDGKSFAFSSDHESHTIMAVKWLLSSGQSPNTIVRLNHTAITPLQVASQSFNLQLVELLLEKNADANLLTDSNSLSPLEIVLGKYPFSRDIHIMGTSVASRIAELLLTHGATRNLDRALDIAITKWPKPNTDLATAILRQGAEHRRHLDLDHALRLAISRSNREVALAILGQGAKLCSSFNPPSGFVYEETALSVAAAVGKEKTEFVLHLLASEYPWNTVDSFITADVLISAAAAKKDATISLLHCISSTGSSPVTFANLFGITPLHAAASNGHRSTCQLLLQLYSPYTDLTGYFSPMHLAYYKGYTDIVQCLLHHGADANDLSATSDVSNEDAPRYFAPGISWLPYCLTPLGMLLSPEGALCWNSEHLDCATTLIQGGARLTGCELVVAAGYRHPKFLSAALAMRDNSNDTGAQGDNALQVILSSWSSSDRDLTCAALLLEKGATPRPGEVISAVRLDNRSLVSLLLRYGGSLAETDNTGMTALEAAIMFKMPHLIDSVFKAHPDTYDAGSLCAAIMHDMDSVIDRLLANRPFRAQADALEGTAVGLATRWGDLIVLRKLLRCIPHPDVAVLPTPSSPLMPRAYYSTSRTSNKPFWRKEYCVQGSPLDLAVTNIEAMETRRDLLKRSDHGEKLTWKLAVKNNDLIVKGLRDSTQGPRIDSQLQRAPPECSLSSDPIRFFNKMSVVLPLDTGSDVKDHSPEHDKTLSNLQHAVENGNLNTVDRLLKKGADANEHNREIPFSRAPLQIAVEHGNLSIVDCLLESGAKVNAPPASYGGGTALQFAAMKGYLGLAKLLIDRGAQVNAMPSRCYGRSAIEGAAEYERIDMLELLLHHGDFTTRAGRLQYVKAMKRAVRGGCRAAVRLLPGYRKWEEEDEALFNDKGLLNGMQSRIDSARGDSSEDIDSEGEDSGGDSSDDDSESDGGCQILEGAAWVHVH